MMETLNVVGAHDKICSSCLRCALIIMNVPCSMALVNNAHIDEGMLERLTRGSEERETDEKRYAILYT